MSEADMNKLPDNYSTAPGAEALLRQTDLRNHSFARFGSAAGDITSGTKGSYSQDSIMSQVVSSEVDFAIDVISKRIANFDFEVYKDTVSKELGALKSVRYVLNHRANEYSNSYQFVYKLTSQLIKYGNALAVPKYDKDNMIESMYVVDFNRVAFIKDEADHEVYVFLAKNQKQFNAYKS